MDAATETAVYERTIAIDASPETVWEFLVDPQKVMRWMGLDAELDPQPGGVYRLDLISGNTALAYGLKAVSIRPLDVAGWRLLASALVKPMPRDGSA